MKKIAGLLAVLMLLSACSGTDGEAYSTIESSNVQAEVILPPDNSSEVSSESASEIASSESEAESVPVSSDSEHGDQMLPLIDTDDAAFQEKFSQNVLDLAYEEEMMSALSAVEWVNICSKYSELWQNEIDNAYKELLVLVPEERYSTLRQEQEQWVTDIATRTAEIQASANAEGGSLMMFNAASEIMLLYRSRAAALYGELYQYNPEFSFSFVANG